MQRDAGKGKDERVERVTAPSAINWRLIGRAAQHRTTNWPEVALERKVSIILILLDHNFLIQVVELRRRGLKLSTRCHFAFAGRLLAKVSES